MLLLSRLLHPPLPPIPARQHGRPQQGVPHSALWPSSSPPSSPPSTTAWTPQQISHPGRSAALVVTAASASGSDAETANDAAQRTLVRALLLAYFACQNQSLFATKSFIETVLHIHRQGCTYDDIQLTLSTMALETGNTLLSPIDQDLLLSWVALVLMTLQETGVPVNPPGALRPPRTTTEEAFHMSEGMRGFARHIIQQYCEQGLTFARLQMTQSLANMEGDSPSVRVMQSNTRLVVITLEVLRDNHVATAMSIEPRKVDEEEEGDEDNDVLAAAAMRDDSPTGGGDDAAGDAATAETDNAVVVNGYREAMSMDGVISAVDYVYCFVAEQDNTDLISLRSSAVRLLICFMGAACQSLYAVTALVELAFDAYCRGWSAEDVFLQLRTEEFVQTGGVASLAIAGVPNPDSVTRELFARWLSLLYMTYAQLGVPRPPSASNQDGWAWAGGGIMGDRSAAEAQSMADFVMHMLQQRAREEGGGDVDWNAEWARVQALVGALEDNASTATDSLPFAPDTVATDGAAVEAGGRWTGLSLVKVEDVSVADNSPAAQLIAQQVSLVDMAYEHAKRQLEALQQLQQS